jgi:hypothetical protein
VDLVYMCCEDGAALDLRLTQSRAGLFYLYSLYVGTGVAQEV